MSEGAGSGTAEELGALTARQAEYLGCIIDYSRERGYPPTMAELCEEMGVASTNVVSDMLLAIERKGYIEREPGSSRAITVVRDARGERMKQGPRVAPPEPPIATLLRQVSDDEVRRLKRVFEHVRRTHRTPLGSRESMREHNRIDCVYSHVLGEHDRRKL